MNVVALENDPKQFTATVAAMRLFAPSSNAAMVYTHEHLVFGYKNLAFHEEHDEAAAATKTCKTC